MKRVSIVIPCYNAENYIDRCLASLEVQTIGIDALEIIIVNDASTDSTQVHLDEWVRRYPKSIQVICLDQNSGQGVARNIALKTVTAPAVGFVDADDWCEPEMYELLDSALIEHDCDLVICQTIRDDGTITDIHKSGEGRIMTFDSDEKRAENIAYHTMGDGMCDTLSRTAWIRDHHMGFIEGRRYEDFLWSAQTHIYAERVCVLEDELYHYYLNLDSTVFKGSMDQQKDLFESAMLTLEYCQELPEYQIYQDAIEFNYIRTFYFQGLQMLAYRFERPDVAIFYWMRDTMNTLLPSWRENIYIKKGLKELFMNMLALMEIDVTEDGFWRFLQIFRMIEC